MASITIAASVASSTITSTATEPFTGILAV
jgi:hypothetical protein